MNAIVLVGGMLVGSVLLVGHTVADETDSAALQGTWRVASTTINGKLFKDQQLSGSRLSFRGDKLMISRADGSESEQFELEPEARSVPAAIHLTRVVPLNRPQRGWWIYEAKGDHMRVAFFDALRERPVSFDPRPKLIVLDLERVVESQSSSDL